MSEDIRRMVKRRRYLQRKSIDLANAPGSKIREKPRVDREILEINQKLFETGV